MAGGAASGSLRVRLARLRALLEPERAAGAPPKLFVREPAGYRLVVAPGSVDAERFCRLAEEAARLPAPAALVEDRAGKLEAATPLLGYVPELDSMAVLELILALEQCFGITIEDDT